MSVERDLLTLMFEGDLDLAKSFNRVGELRCAKQHLQGATEKLAQIAALDNDGHAAEPELKNITNAK